MILQSLYRRAVRTLLTTFGIAVGVMAVVALGALADGFVEGYTAMAGGSGADLLDEVWTSLNPAYRVSAVVLSVESGVEGALVRNAS